MTNDTIREEPSGENLRFHRVARLLGLDKAIPENADEVRFSVLGMFASELEKRQTATTKQRETITALKLELDLANNRIAEQNRINSGLVDHLEKVEQKLLAGQTAHAEQMRENNLRFKQFEKALADCMNDRRVEQLASEKLRDAISRTVDENGHLADGDNCTLMHLVRALAIKPDHSLLLEFEAGAIQDFGQSFADNDDAVIVKNDVVRIANCRAQEIREGK